MNTTGTIYMTNDINMAIMESEKPNSKVIYIDDELVPILQNNPKVINASIFIPGYDLICTFMDGDRDNAYKGYENHLNKYFVKPAISILAELLIAGTNFLIYIPNHIYDLVSYIGVFLRNHYGIICGCMNIAYMYDANYNDSNLGLLYCNNYIGYGDYLKESSLGAYDYSRNIFNKLLQDINPVLKDYTPEEYSKYFMELQGVLKSSEKNLRPAIVSI